MKKGILVFVLLCVGITGFSQVDSTASKMRKNSIKWNITPMVIIGPKSIVLSYERVINNRMSASVTAGRLELPPLSDRNGAIFKFVNSSERGGYDFATDFRFFFKNRNKFPVPDGLYWGPFASVYNLNFSGEADVYSNDIKINKVDLQTNLMIYNLGVQLGYQFIIKKRFSIDLHLFGPSLSEYSYKFDINSEFAIDKNSDFYQNYEQFLQKLFPGGEFIFSDLDFQVNGKVTRRNLGYRYGIQIGYVF